MTISYLEFNGTLYEPIFATSRGSDYFFSKISGLWIRRRKNGEIEDDKNIYVGSLGDNAEIDVLEVFRDLDNGIVKDFLPELVVGRDPFGIGLEKRVIAPTDLVRLARGEVRLFPGLQTETGWHRGHTIRRMYRTFDPLQEYGFHSRRAR